MTGEAALQLRDVGKDFPLAPDVLSDVSLEVAAGECLAVTGGNGSGKTTLLKIILGLSRPSSGSVLRRPDVVAYVPERFPSQQRLSAEGYLTHLGRVRGLSGGQARARAEYWLDRLGLADGSGTPLRQLSKGNAQKVALAQALLVPCGLLVLDEPRTGLDVAAQGVLTDVLDEVTRAGACVVLTDHDPDVVARWATRTCRLEAGRLSDVQPPPSAPATGVARIALARRAAGVEDLGDVPGVLTARVTTDGAELTVDDALCDAVLSTVLGNGWSVRTVRRDDAA